MLDVFFVKEFAGLEADAIIYFKLGDFDHRVHYTALSRARTLVVEMDYTIFWGKF